jgi:hypothetical protein
MKLKKLLEGFAWERQPGKPLPTLEDVTKNHQMNEVPNIQRAKVDYSTMDLKSNINMKWRSYDDMFHDLQQWIEVSTDGMGDAQVRQMARELKELSLKYLQYKSDMMSKSAFAPDKDFDVDKTMNQNWGG